MKNLLFFLKTCTGKKTTGEEGQGLVEYSLIILLIAIAVIVALRVFGVDLGGIYENIKDAIEALL
ncbi:hypothetical protein SAMN02745945_00967 [Peptoclostridium litorale DSM 5388]|uniref:Flp family type IVb pilin n=1 Tax=Peptoclostridium litorale DSM 5388 TaxID=1121324 RepID=A0A069RHN0_PEPLI|nr:hypothetical protein [Peptoclostridium litorale]KDR93772.1 hypothetical protein CLIT_23c00440 [Peptoclostridium litorale DSM 5388]SIN85563.1 hypothetical protein SAMN02745945_00967 [Peptoclostridium litorale DSM 5388]